MRDYTAGLIVSGVILLACIVCISTSRIYFARTIPPPPTVPEMTREEAVALDISRTDPHELLPDLVPLPAEDLKLVRTSLTTLRLLFSTTYFNQGRGPLELRADPRTATAQYDVEREVRQRIYFTDGGYWEKPVGTFLWHQTHRHHHYTNFIDYTIEPVNAPGSPTLSGILQKTTFCLRDVSYVTDEIEGASKKARYMTCGRSIQGVSVGWGDTYFYNYPDQALDISVLPTGTYKLSFIVNSERRLAELSYANNESHVVFSLNRASSTVTITERYPEDSPNVEHVHLDDPFGI